MLVFRCTDKFARLMGTNRHRLAEPSESGYLGSWFAHRFPIEGRKCVIFTHEETLFSVVEVDVLKSDLADLGTFFADRLIRSLAACDLAAPSPERVREASKRVVLAPTNNRSVVGSMNDLWFMAEVHTETGGGLALFDFDDVCRFVNRTPMSALSYDRPAEAFRKRFSAET